MRNARLFSVLLLIFALAGLCLPAQAQGPTPTPSSTGTPRYGVHGPFSIATTWFILDKDASSPLLFVMWYPTFKQATSQPQAALVVPVEYQLPNIDMAQNSVGWGSALANASPDISGAPYPLVIFSPGYGATPKLYIEIEEHLASHGFVVLAAMTLGQENVWDHFLERPPIIHREIDLAEGLTSRAGSFKGLIDTRHVGVVGHSSGGYTALAAAGAQLNLAWFERWCIDYKDDPDAKWACSDVLTHKKDMLALAKLDSMPKDLWPSLGDPRVTAVISQSGDAYVFGPQGLASVTVPVMVQVGSKDTNNVPQWNAFLTYENVSSAQKAQVMISGGSHMIFVDGYTLEVTSEIIHHFTTAFLLDILKGDKDAHKALLPDAAKFPGIEYKTTLK